MNYAVRVRLERDKPWGLLNVFEVNDYRTPGTHIDVADEKCRTAAQQMAAKWSAFFPSAQLQVHPGDYKRCQEVNNTGQP